MQAASIETASIETASIEIASIEIASIETVETAAERMDVDDVRLARAGAQCLIPDRGSLDRG
ncbi:MAG: hypothetical protein IT537_03595 [Hyphomicrobiales bacterium]|nr:hypothetical protein [Hyphomicrobiales bacterium]